MKKILEQSKAIIYENVERVRKHIGEYPVSDEMDLDEMAKNILNELKIPLGKKMEVKLFKNNVYAVLENGKITIKTK